MELGFCGSGFGFFFGGVFGGAFLGVDGEGGEVGCYGVCSYIEELVLTMGLSGAVLVE